MKIDATRFDVKMTTHSQDITKKQSYRPPHKQILLCNMYIQGKYFSLHGET